MKSYCEVTLSEAQDDSIRKKARTVNKYFKKAQVTVTAAAKMLNHATYGIPRQVMGLLTGFYREQKGEGVFTVTDVIALPVQASQTRVTADDETYTLIASYTLWLSKIKTHNIVGWYHSHPSYGCWLSGIDVNTQEIFQMSNDPFLAIVVDPIKSANLQKVDLGAFRVHPKGYKEQSLGNITDVPRRKAVDFGVHYQKYYQVPVELVTNQIGASTLKNVQKLQWASQLSNSSFFEQKEYLTQQAKDQKQDFQQFLQASTNTNSTHEQIKLKQKDTFKKISHYAKQRNVSLVDTAIKNLLF